MFIEVTQFLGADEYRKCWWNMDTVEKFYESKRGTILHLKDGRKLVMSDKYEVVAAKVSKAQISLAK